VLDADRADDLGQHPRGRTLEVHLLGQRLEQVVRVTRVHTEHVEVAGDVGAGETEIARRRRQVRRAAGGLEVEPE
jgi:hypothetical protein